MSILVDANTRVIVQGLTGKAGSFHAEQALAYCGTKIVAGVHPQKGGQTWRSSTGKEVPLFSCVAQAREETSADLSLIYVPAPTAASAILESIDAEIPLIVCITEGIPVLDMVRVKMRLERSSSRLLGPNCPGLLTAGACKIGIMPASIFRKGSVGVVSRSGTLAYEAVFQITQIGLGQSTAVGIGGDPVKGLDFVDILEMFLADPQTDSILMIGEIGGACEEKAARFLMDEARCGRRKPVAAFIAGSAAPAGRTMGHAGAVISRGAGDARSKIEALASAGVHMAHSPVLMGETLMHALKA